MSSQVRWYEYTFHQNFVVLAFARWSSATWWGNVREDFTVPLRYFTQSCWAQWQSYETLKGHPLLHLCIMHPITILIIFISTEYPGYSSGWKFYLSSRETCIPVCERHCPVRKLNLVFDYKKCQRMMLTGVAEGYWHIHVDISMVVRYPLDIYKGPYSPKYYVAVYFVFGHWLTFLHTSPELWKRRLHESILFVILLGWSWLSDDIISVP